MKWIENINFMFDCEKCEHSEFCKHRNYIKHAGQSMLTIKETHYASEPYLLAKGFEITVNCSNFEEKV